MNALSKLLAKVAIRAIKNAKTNDELFDAAERVINWSANGLITDTHVEQVEEVMEETVSDLPASDYETEEEDEASGQESATE